MPHAALSLGQADAGHEEAALKEPHPPADVVSSTTKIFFSYLKAANGCPIYRFIAAPFCSHSIVFYYTMSSGHGIPPGELGAWLSAVNAETRCAMI